MSELAPQECTLCAASMQPYVVCSVRGERFYDRCGSCGLISERLADLPTFDMPAEGIEALTPEMRERFHDRFGESIQVGSEEGDLYAMYEFDDSTEMIRGLADRVERLVDVSSVRTVLEVGCASGFLLRELELRMPEASFIGVDPSPISHKQAVAAGTTNTLVGTLDSVEVPDGQDLVVLFGNLMLHPDPVDTLRRCTALLADDGVVVFDVKNRNCLTRRIAGALGQHYPKLPGPLRAFVNRNFTNARHLFDRKTLALMCEEAGLQLVSVESSPPRALEYSNRHRGSNGVAGMLWAATDRIDRLRDDRAWLIATARRA